VSSVYPRSLIGTGYGQAGVLLTEPERPALALQPTQQVVELVDQQGRRPVRGLVEHQEVGVSGEGAGDGQHLLLSPRQAPPALPPALPEHREVLEDPLERPAIG